MTTVIRELLLGIDLGTTFCKAAVVDLAGRELAHGRVATPWTVVPTGAEIDPRAFVRIAVAAAEDALARVPDGRVVGIGVTSMAETGVLVDERAEPVVPAIAWHDARGSEQAEHLAAMLGRDRFTTRTGLPVSRLCTAAKLRWLMEHVTDARRGRRWLSVAEWVVYQLGGDQVAECSLASRTGFLDLEACAWWDEVVAWAGVPEGLLPPLVPAGTAVGRVAPGRLRRADGAVLTVGGHDHPCAAVGAGATAPGDLFDSHGTAESLVRAVPPPVQEHDIRRAVDGGVTVGWHVVDGLMALQGGFLSGRALQRFLDLLGCEPAERAALDAAALRAPLGAGGLSVSGVADDRATLSGIGWDVTPGLVWRAALEAVARHAAGIARVIDEIAGPADRLVVTGGWTRSEAVRAVKRAYLGEFVYPPVVEAGARGAALLAGVAAGRYAHTGELPPPA